MMKKHRFSPLAILFICLSLSFPVSSPAQQRGASGQKCFLWQVRSGASIVYLLGSIHMGRPDMYPLDQRIEDAFAGSQKLVVEADIENINLQNPGSLFGDMLYPGEETLKDNLSQRTYDLVGDKLKELSLPIEMLEKFKPWYVAMLFEQLRLLNLGFDPGSGIDLYFLDKARGNKEILEMESMQFQIDLFNKLSRSQQDTFLYYTLKSLDNIEETMNRLVEAWKQGDAQTLGSLLAKTTTEDPELASIYQKILYERNYTMEAKVEQFLNSEGTYLVIVGAGHLVGEKGIVALLRQKGYSVEQL